MLALVVVRLLQVLYTGKAEPSFLLQHGVLTTIPRQRVLPTCGRGVLGRRPKYPSFGMWCPVLIRLRLDQFIRYHTWSNLLIRVLVVR